MNHATPTILSLSLLAASSAADTIHLTNGKSIDDCKIGQETYTQIEYREGGKTGKVDTDRVLRIEFSALPALVDRAETAARDEQVYDAIADLEEYVAGAGGRDRRYPWAPAHAMFRLVELKFMVGDASGAEAAAEQLIEKAPNSRYVPLAYLAQAQAQFDQGGGDKAQATVRSFEAAIQKASMSQRWKLECDLARVLFDSSLKGSARRDKLAEVSASAGRAYPTVRNRADVAEAETWLEAREFEKAELIFEKIVDDPKADAGTLAAAYTGHGDCLFQRAFALGDGTEKDGLYRKALLSFMRVVVVYGDQVRYVPKAMLLAARIFDQADDEVSKERAQRLYRTVMRLYEGSSWAQEARGFKK
ncbi:MAG: hypothetical protein QF903_16375 [Planctomycetota bacterium]|jgi:tetratricopeptide (TPR) repeat protein|nr:hypothetical protein [Planctomycetota bacterium]